MRDHVQIDKTVTIYFDILSNVIFHWFAVHTGEREFIGEENNRCNRRGEKGERIGRSQVVKKGETPCPLPPNNPLQVIKDRGPLIGLHIGAHVLVHSSGPVLKRRM